MNVEIVSLQNNKVKEWYKLQQKKYRDETGLFIIEDEHLIEEANKHGLIQHLLIRKGVENIFAMEPIFVTDEIMHKLSSTTSLNKYLAICKKPKISSDKKRCFVLDQVQDPGNVGTIIRTAYSFGFDTVILSKNCADEYSSKVIRSSQGAIFHIAVIREDLTKEIQQLKENGCTIYGTSLHNAKPLQEYPPKENIAIVLGNEGKGVSDEILDICDHHIFIEMSQFESLNVAVAGGIVAYHFRKME